MYSSHRHKVFTRIDYVLTDLNSRDKITSCSIGPILRTDHACLKWNFDLAIKENPYRQWSFNKSILLTDYWKQETALEIENNFKSNKSESISQSTFWDSMKVVTHGRAISVSAALQMKKQKQQQMIINNIKRLEHLHKQKEGGKIFKNLTVYLLHSLFYWPLYTENWNSI